MYIADDVCNGDRILTTASMFGGMWHVQRLLDSRFDGVSDESKNIAFITEMGEFFQAIKPTWAWWKRQDKEFVAGDNALEELVDAMHFWLSAQPHYTIVPRVKVIATRYHNSQQYSIAQESMYLSVWDIVQFPLLARAIGYSEKDLYSTYIKKAKKNLWRWGRDSEAPMVDDVAREGAIDCCKQLTAL